MYVYSTAFLCMVIHLYICVCVCEYVLLSMVMTLLPMPRPSNVSGLHLVEDFSAAKAERFGASLVETIVTFCQQHGLPIDQFPQVTTEVCRVLPVNFRGFNCVDNLTLVTSSLPLYIYGHFSSSLSICVLLESVVV